MTDTPIRQRAPAAERNREPILAVLKDVLPARGLVLEIASGTGQHAVAFASALPSLDWQPTDANADALQSIAAWRTHARLANLREPLALDVHDARWPVGVADAIVCINMIHIAPWSAAEALFAHAGEVLTDDGVLVLYGPYRRGGAHTAPSNAAFDDQLRERDPRWGVREMEAVQALGRGAGLSMDEAVTMPANNFCLVFRKRRAAAAV